MAELAPKNRRARSVQQGLEKASSNVIKVLTPAAMSKCFPEQSRDYPDIFNHLRQGVVESFNSAVPENWNRVKQTYDFDRKVNELERLIGEAEERLEKGEEPSNMWLKGSNSSITIPCATVPIIQTAIAELREKRLALEKKNKSTYETILVQKTNAERQDARIRELVADFQLSMNALEKVDYKTVEKLQARILEGTP